MEWTVVTDNFIDNRRIAEASKIFFGDFNKQTISLNQRMSKYQTYKVIKLSCSLNHMKYISFNCYILSNYGRLIEDLV